MKIPACPFLLYLLSSVVSASAAAQREESVLIFENRKISVAVPPGFTFAAARDDRGLAALDLADAGKKLSLRIELLPDSEERSLQARGRKEQMVELFDEFVAGSVEKAMQFEELEPRSGAGTYCVFTDAKWVGKTDLPAGEYLKLTVGVKAWRGVIAVFRLFSQETTSAEYQAALRLLRDSVEERAVPLR